MADDPKDYEVGYGKPPKATQFQKGKSGNPKGRPKNSQNLITRFWKLANRKIVIKEGNRQMEVPMFDVVILQLLRQAGNGNVSAARETIRVASLELPDLAAGREIFDAKTGQNLMRSFIERFGTIEPEPVERPLNVID